MMPQLTWAALIAAALAALACWNHEEPPACLEGRSVFGDSPCCDRHRLVGPVAEHYEAVVAEWRSRADTAALP